jgi:hypothetical protein
LEAGVAEDEEIRSARQDTTGGNSEVPESPTPNPLPQGQTTLRDGAPEELLHRAVKDAESLQNRLEAGEDVSEDEMIAIARGVAEAIEEANAKLREMLGSMDTALLREKLVENMTQEEFEAWSDDNATLQEYRARKKAEAQDG